MIVDDPINNMFLDLAVDGNADVIVSGDRHLLELKTFRILPSCRCGRFSRLSPLWKNKAESDPSLGLLMLS